MNKREADLLMDLYMKRMDRAFNSQDAFGRLLSFFTPGPVAVSLFGSMSIAFISRHRACLCLGIILKGYHPHKGIHPSKHILL